jgi:hypothetical protein
LRDHLAPVGSFLFERVIELSGVPSFNAAASGGLAETC